MTRIGRKSIPKSATILVTVTVNDETVFVGTVADPTDVLVVTHRNNGPSRLICTLPSISAQIRK